METTATNQNLPIKVERTSGVAYLNGRQVGKIEWPGEEAGRSSRRRTFKVIMAGTAIGTYPDLKAAHAAAVGWTPTDEVGHKLVARPAWS